MHALTCEVLPQDGYAYAMIPTYYQPNKFIACKVYIEFVYHGDMHIFYHCTIAELLDDVMQCMQTLPAALVRALHRQSHQLSLQNMQVKQFALTKEAMLQSIQMWQKDFVLDVPAPFVCSTEAKLALMQNDIKQYFKELAK